MTVGLHQPVEIDKIGVDQQEPTGRPMPAPKTSSVIGVICSGDLAVHRDEIKAAISRGLIERPDAVWVCVEPKSDRMTHDVMISLDIEPVVLPMMSYWQVKDSEGKALLDVRRTWRDLEMLHLCDELIVFHRRTGNSPWRDRVKSGLYDGRLFIVEIGKLPPAKGRKSRKPIGA